MAFPIPPELLGAVPADSLFHQTAAAGTRDAVKAYTVHVCARQSAAVPDETLERESAVVAQCLLHLATARGVAPSAFLPLDRLLRRLMDISHGAVTETMLREHVDAWLAAGALDGDDMPRLLFYARQDKTFAERHAAVLGDYCRTWLEKVVVDSPEAPVLLALAAELRPAPASLLAGAVRCASGRDGMSTTVKETAALLLCRVVRTTMGDAPQKDVACALAAALIDPAIVAPPVDGLGNLSETVDPLVAASGLLVFKDGLLSQPVAAGHKTLLDLLFDLLLDARAFRHLAIWLERSLGKTGTTASVDQIDALIAVLLCEFDIATAGNALVLLRSLMPLLAKVVRALGDDAYTDALVRRVLVLEWTSRAKSAFLDAMVPAFGYRVFARADEHFLAGVVQATGEQSVSHAASAVFGKILAAKDADRDACAEALAMGMLAPRADRVMMGQNTLSLVVRADKALLAPVLAVFAKRAADSDAAMYSLAVALKLARPVHPLARLDTLDQLHPDLPAAVARGLAHGDDGIRLSLFHFLAVPTNRRETPSEAELAAVREFCKHNAKHFATTDYGQILSQHVAACAAPGAAHADSAEEQMQAAHVTWLADFHFASLYPGSPFDRRAAAVNLLATLVRRKAWSPDAAQTAKLVEQLEDRWDKHRQAVYALLMDVRGPMRGFEELAPVAGVLTRAQTLLASVRQRETDSGGLLLRFIFAKFVAQLGWLAHWDEGTGQLAWVATADGDVAVAESPAAAVTAFLVALRTGLEARAQLFCQTLNRKENGHATRKPLNGFLDGVQYVLGNAILGKTGADATVAAALDGMIATCKRVVSFSLNSMATYMAYRAYWSAGNFADDDDDDDDGGDGGADAAALGLDAGAMPASADAKDISPTDGNEAMSADDNVAILCCWLATRNAVHVVERIVVDAPQTTAQMRVGGQIILQALMGTKHDGIIDQAARSLRLLTARLLASSDDDARALPDEWLAWLLGKMQPGSEQHPYVRRSSGLPHGVMAILHGETNGQCRRFHATVEQLLDTDADSDVVLRVHALNTLMFILRDAGMDVRCSPYIVRVFQTAFQGYFSAEWIVRSAASLVLTAVVRRAIGTVVSGKPVTTAAALFHRYPDLRPYLVDQLQQAVAGSGGDELHPALFPVLYILALLKPTLAVLDADESGETARGFEPLLRACLHHKHYHVRTVASTALLSLLPLDDPLATLRDEVDCIRGGLEMNQLHGSVARMLTLLKFLSSVAGELETRHATFWSDAVTLLDTVVVDCLMANAPAVRECFARAGLVIARHVRALPDAWCVFARNGLSLPRTVAGAGAWQGVAVELMAATGAGISVDDRLRLIGAADVPEATMAALDTITAHADADALVPAIVDRLLGEGHPLIVRAALQALARLSDLNLDAERFDALWTLLGNMLDEQGENEAIAEPALALSGRLVAAGRLSTEALGAWVSRLDRFSRAEQLETAREATVSAIGHSRLLLPSEVDANDTAVVMRIWLVLVRLLEDDDELVRPMAARVAGEALGRAGGSTEHVGNLLRGAFVAMTDRHALASPDVVVECMSEFLAAVRASAVVAWETAATSLLFAHEPANAHEEPLVVGLLACRLLATALRDASAPVADAAGVLASATCAPFDALSDAVRASPAVFALAARARAFHAVTHRRELPASVAPYAIIA